MNTTEGISVKSSYLSFLLDKGIFAINVSKVLEVLEKQPITFVPDTPKHIVGVLNFRGEILPVIEMRLKFNMPSGNLEKFVIIVLELMINGKPQIFGAIVDSVVDVIEIYNNTIKSVPEMGSNFNPEYISGMIKSDKGFIMFLNIDKVFSHDEIKLIINENLKQ